MRRPMPFFKRLWRSFLAGMGLAACTLFMAIFSPLAGCSLYFGRGSDAFTGALTVAWLGGFIGFTLAFIVFDEIDDEEEGREREHGFGQHEHVCRRCQATFWDACDISYQRSEPLCFDCTRANLLAKE